MRILNWFVSLGETIVFELGLFRIFPTLELIDEIIFEQIDPIMDPEDWKCDPLIPTIDIPDDWQP